MLALLKYFWFQVREIHSNYVKSREQCRKELDSITRPRAAVLKRCRRANAGSKAAGTSLRVHRSGPRPLPSCCFLCPVNLSSWRRPISPPPLIQNIFMSPQQTRAVGEVPSHAVRNRGARGLAVPRDSAHVSPQRK